MPPIPLPFLVQQEEGQGLLCLSGLLVLAQKGSFPVPGPRETSCNCSEFLGQALSHLFPIGVQGLGVSSRQEPTVTYHRRACGCQTPSRQLSTPTLIVAGIQESCGWAQRLPGKPTRAIVPLAPHMIVSDAHYPITQHLDVGSYAPEAIASKRSLLAKLGPQGDQKTWYRQQASVLLASLSFPGIWLPDSPPWKRVEMLICLSSTEEQ